MLIISRPAIARTSGFAEGTLLNNQKAVLIAQLGINLLSEPSRLDINRLEIGGDLLAVFAAPPQSIARLTNQFDGHTSSINASKKRLVDTSANLLVAGKDKGLTAITFGGRNVAQIDIKSALVYSVGTIKTANLAVANAKATNLANTDFIKANN